jgi:type III pantothenate kinase
MLLVCDVGNTETTIGVAAGTEIRQHWRVTTGTPRTPDEWRLLLFSLAMSRGTGASAIRGAAIASVVPAVTMPLTEGIAAGFRVTPRIIDGGSPLPITLEVDEPKTVGADRIVNTLAASRIYERDCIVVDLGTATTYDCITRDGAFIGGVIAPGVITSLDTLTRRTSKLPATQLSVPERVIGRRTEECIRSGVVFGAVDAITGIVTRIRADWPTSEKPMVIATGGLASMLAPMCPVIDAVDPDLTLKGLSIAHTLVSASLAA